MKLLRTRLALLGSVVLAGCASPELNLYGADKRAGLP